MLQTIPEPKNLTWSVPFFGRGTILFGCGAENFSAETKQYTAFVKFFGGELSTETVGSLALETENCEVEAKRFGLQSKESKPEIKIFTFGLFVLKINSRVRAGFVKRRQVLVEA